jgi:hypothetical protein
MLQLQEAGRAERGGNDVLPESHEITNKVFLGEFFWAPAFAYHDTPNYRHDGWTRGDDNRIPKKVLVTTEKYAKEYNGYDCSIDQSIRLYLPAKWLVDHMNLRSNGIEGYFFDDKGNLVAFDPSVRNAGPGALLINREALLKFLNENGYEILWTLLGEKMATSGRVAPETILGRLEISGAYRILKNEIVGKINSRLSSR